MCVQRNPRSGRVITMYRFRPLAPVGYAPRMWRPLTSWPGKLPKGLRAYFDFTRRSVEIARGAPAGTSTAWLAAVPASARL